MSRLFFLFPYVRVHNLLTSPLSLGLHFFFIIVNSVVWENFWDLVFKICGTSRHWNAHYYFIQPKIVFISRAKVAFRSLLVNLGLLLKSYTFHPPDKTYYYGDTLFKDQTIKVKASFVVLLFVSRWRPQMPYSSLHSNHIIQSCLRSQSVDLLKMKTLVRNLNL